MLVVSRKMGQYWKKETLNFLISYRWNKYLSTKFYSFLLGKNINLPVAKKKKEKKNKDQNNWNHCKNKKKYSDGLF